MGTASLLVSLAVKPENLELIDLLMDYKLMFSGFFLIGIVFMAIGFLISSLIPHLRLAMPLGIGVFFITYLLGIFSGMIEKLNFLKYLSPFHYAVPSEVIKNGLQPSYIILALVIITVSFMITYLLYKKKDFRI
jgi:ABC-2 type transport system permease protein